MISGDGCARCSAASIESTTAAPGAENPRREMTMLSRPGSARPIDSNVLRPMTTGLPMVSALKRRRSSGSRHGKRPPAPITSFSEAATTMHSRLMLRMLRNRSALLRGGLLPVRLLAVLFLLIERLAIQHGAATTLGAAAASIERQLPGIVGALP